MERYIKHVYYQGNWDTMYFLMQFIKCLCSEDERLRTVSDLQLERLKFRGGGGNAIKSHTEYASLSHYTIVNIIQGTYHDLRFVVFSWNARLIYSWMSLVDINCMGIYKIRHAGIHLALIIPEKKVWCYYIQGSK